VPLDQRRDQWRCVNDGCVAWIKDVQRAPFSGLRAPARSGLLDHLV
jgi:hypothetical protein